LPSILKSGERVAIHISIQTKITKTDFGTVLHTIEQFRYLGGVHFGVEAIKG
jgi:hypothetical protein